MKEGQLSMLSRHHAPLWSQLFELSDKQWIAIVCGALAVAALSAIRPEYAKLLLRRAVRNLSRHFTSFRHLKKAGDGIVIAGEFIPDEARLRHVHIVGATGSGKTVLLEQLIYEDLVRGHGALIIDPKGDRDLYHRVRDFCRSIGREKDLHLLSATWPEESVRWNPCSLGGASELQSKWLNSGVYSEPFYAKACELGLLEAFVEILEDRPEGFTLKDLVQKLSSHAEDGKNKNIQGLFFDLQAFAKSEWGEILAATPSRHGAPVISLLEITSRNQILFVDLPTESKAVQSARVGKLLLQELMLVSGLRKIHPDLKSHRPLSVFIDEFDAFATENFATFQNKGRSSDFMIHLAHQTLSDLKKVSETFQGQTMGNCNVRFIFRQDDPDDAETWSKYLGTKKTKKFTDQIESGFGTGRGSMREVEEFRVHPNEIKDLGVGECIFSMKTERVMRQLKIPFPPKRPKRRGRPLERGTPKTQGQEVATSADFDRVTTAQGSLLEEARRSAISSEKPILTTKTKF